MAVSSGCKILSFFFFFKSSILKKIFIWLQQVLVVAHRIFSCAMQYQTDGETVADFTFWASKSLQMVTAIMKLEGACSLQEKLWLT